MVRYEPLVVAAVLASLVAACSTLSPERNEAPPSEAAPELAVRPPSVEPLTPRPAFLRWNFDEGYVPKDSPSYTICHAESVSWVDEADSVQWTTAVPKRMSDADSGLCECRRVDDGGPCAAELQLYEENPRERSPPFVLGTHDLGGRVIVGDSVGVLALEKLDGAIAASEALAFDKANYFFYDDGTWALEGDGTCHGEASRGRLFVRCGERLVYFNGTTAALIRVSDLQVIAVGTYDRTRIPGSTKPASTRIRLGNEWLRLEGMIYL